MSSVDRTLGCPLRKMYADGHAMQLPAFVYIDLAGSRVGLQLCRETATLFLSV